MALDDLIGHGIELELLLAEEFVDRLLNLIILHLLLQLLEILVAHVDGSVWVRLDPPLIRYPAVHVNCW